MSGAPCPVFHTADFPLPLPAGHPFPAHKYRLLVDRVIAELGGRVAVQVAPAVRDEELRLAHDPDYVARVRAGTLRAAEIQRIGFPWSPEMVERSLRSTGATVAAARVALDRGVAVHLGGGTHHAFADGGAGYCVFHDVVVAARVVQRERGVRRILVVDLDVHQGDGTATMTAGDDTVFTFSMHGARNYPRVKQRSDLDVELPDGTGDAVFLAELERGLPLAFERSRPELVFYLAGADPFLDDRLGRLALTKAGLLARDHAVLDAVARAGAALVVTLAGGYARRIEDSVDIHCATVAAVVGSDLARGRDPAAERA